MARKEKDKEKDPAFLFYSNDWIAGTYGLSAQQKGWYIDILCLMHQKGRLPKDTILKVTGDIIDDRLFDNFEVDENGLWYNVKLEKVIEQRKRNAERASENAKKRNAGGYKTSAKASAEYSAKPQRNPQQNDQRNECMRTEDEDIDEIENSLPIALSIEGTIPQALNSPELDDLYNELFEQ